MLFPLKLLNYRARVFRPRSHICCSVNPEKEQVTARSLSASANGRDREHNVTAPLWSNSSSRTVSVVLPQQKFTFFDARLLYEHTCSHWVLLSYQMINVVSWVVSRCSMSENVPVRQEILWVLVNFSIKKCVFEFLPGGCVLSGIGAEIVPVLNRADNRFSVRNPRGPQQVVKPTRCKQWVWEDLSTTCRIQTRWRDQCHEKKLPRECTKMFACRSQEVCFSSA